jgi:hypothetical protein
MNIYMYTHAYMHLCLTGRACVGSVASLSSGASAAAAYVLAAVVGGLCALWFQRPFVVMATAVGGAYLVCAGARSPHCRHTTLTLPTHGDPPNGVVRVRVYACVRVCVCVPVWVTKDKAACTGMDVVAEARFQSAMAAILLAVQGVLRGDAEAAVPATSMSFLGTTCIERERDAQTLGCKLHTCVYTHIQTYVLLGLCVWTGLLLSVLWAALSVAGCAIQYNLRGRQLLRRLPCGPYLGSLSVHVRTP